MSRADEILLTGLRVLPAKPADTEKAPVKKHYSEMMSQVIAAALAEELRLRGLRETRPGGDGDLGKSGAERRMSGGIGAKKVDVTWATEESGLILAISVKCITARDVKTGNYQKNLINRRGDMLGEAVTLHRRFPYAVLGGFVFFDKGAAADSSEQRSSTFLNAHRAFRLFTGRNDPSGRDEQYERLYFALVEATPFQSTVKFTLAGSPDVEITLDAALDSLLKLVVDRDPDFYALVGPNGEIDPAADVTPLGLAKMRTSSGVIEKRKTKSTRQVTDAKDSPLESSGPDDSDEDDE
jgi:hypothetical protein